MLSILNNLNFLSAILLQELKKEKNLSLVSLSTQKVSVHIPPHAGFSHIFVPENDNATFGVATANVSLQGNNARLDLFGEGWRQPVGGLYFKDHQRFIGQKKIFERLAAGHSPVGPISIIGVQENFCDGFKRLYETDKGLTGLPYAVFGPSSNGLQDILNRLKSDSRLEKIITSGRVDIAKLVKAFFQNHYAEERAGANILKGLLSVITRGIMTENELLAKLQHFLKANDNDPFIPIGSGLAIFSQFPILDAWFIPFPHRAEFELFTNKGVLIADVLLPTGEIVRVINTHLQDVVSIESQEAQDTQADILRLVIEDSPYRVILIGDLNLTPDSLNHQIIFQEDIKDCHDYLERKQFTFLRKNSLAQARGIIDSSNRTIDYIATKKIAFDVLERLFEAAIAVVDNKDSDHQMVLSRLCMNRAEGEVTVPKNRDFIEYLMKKTA